MLAAVPWLVAPIAGYFVTAWLAERARGAAGFFLLLAWFAAPYAVLWVLLASASDPTLSAERAAYNQSFAFVLTAAGLTIPWALVFLFAVQRGRNRRRRGEGAP
jgi:hypothetical protein